LNLDYIFNKNLQFAFDDKLIINQATFSRVGGTPQTAINQDSIDKYFVHSIAQDNLVAETDAIVAEIAKEYVSTRAKTTIRVDTMTIDLKMPGVDDNDMLKMDYFVNVRINNVQPDGSSIYKVLQVQGLAWDITPNKMLMTLTTLEPIADAFIIGDAFYGIIGVSTLGY
jgi:hypothetical protein